MKKTFTLIAVLSTAICLLVQSYGNLAHSNGNGAPSGNTGSPADGQTCARAGCHVGTATASPTPIISSNIPASGYVPGTTYTITASVISPGGTNKFGFQISPQSTSGQLLGTPVITNTTTTKITNSKYITHTNGGNIGSGGAISWSFNWIAPVAGSGIVKFYGAFNIANGNGQGSGDQIRTDVLTVNENTSVGINEIGEQVNASVYPNPVIDQTTFEFELRTAAQVMINITDLSGRVMKQVNMEGVVGTQKVQLEIPSDWAKGLYTVSLNAGNQKATRTLLKQ
jgi:hypothetical protein